MSANRAYGYSSSSVDPTFARRRMVAGAILGFMAQLAVAVILGMLQVGVGSDTFVVASFASMVATPATFVLAFSLMLSRNGRHFGIGVLIGSLLSTLLLLGGCSAFG